MALQNYEKKKKTLRAMDGCYSVLTAYVPCIVDRDRSVGIATHYGLDGPGSNPGEGEIFLTRPDRTWGPPSLLYNEYQVFLVGKAAGAWR